jgi:hypothetical protein
MAPPGGNGTTQRIDLLGQSAGDAGDCADAAPAKDRLTAKRVKRDFMMMDSVKKQLE